MSRRNNHGKNNHFKSEKLKRIERMATSKPKRQTYYIEYNGVKQSIDNIDLTNHAIRRIKERLGIDDQSQAKGEVKAILRKAKCLGSVISEEGNESILFAHGRTGIFISLDLTKVITVIRQEVVSFEPIKNKLEMMLGKEVGKLNRKEKAKINQLTELRYESNCEISRLELRIYKTKSKSVKMACQARIKAIQMRINEIEGEIESIRSDKRRAIRSIVACV